MEYLDPDEIPYWPNPKDPTDERSYGIDFSGALQAGDTIATITSVTPFPDSLNIPTNAILAGRGGDATLVGFFATEGTAAIDYKISARIVTVLGETLNRSGFLRVRNK
jgi:hypothetical protein